MDFLWLLIFKIISSNVDFASSLIFLLSQQLKIRLPGFYRFFGFSSIYRLISVIFSFYISYYHLKPNFSYSIMLKQYVPIDINNKYAICCKRWLKTNNTLCKLIMSIHKVFIIKINKITSVIRQLLKGRSLEI